MKSLIFRIVLSLLFLVVFNVLFFLLCGTENKDSVWLSYGFIHFAYLLMLILPLFKTKGDASYYLSWTLYSQGFSYFLLELVAGVVFIALNLDSIAWPLIVQTLLWFVFMLIIIANAWANDSTSKSLEKREQELASYQQNRLAIRRLSSLTSNMNLKREINLLYDKMSASSSRQTEQTKSIDNDIECTIAALRQCLYDDDEARSESLLKTLSKQIEERKATLKYSH